MLRHENPAAKGLGDPEWIVETINSARAVIDLTHQFAVLGVLRHCPDVKCVSQRTRSYARSFLYTLYATVLLVKLKLLSPSVGRLIDSDELAGLIHRSISDCQGISHSPRTAPGTLVQCLRVVIASWRAKELGPSSNRSRASSPQHQPPTSAPISTGAGFTHSLPAEASLHSTLAPAPGMSAGPSATAQEHSVRCGACRSVIKDERPMACSRCKKVAYCNRDCQSKDWKPHRQSCEAA